MAKSSIYFILFTVIVIWGISWAINKVGLSYMPPLWFAWWRIVIATVGLFVMLGFTGRLTWPEWRDWPHLLSVGLLLVAAFQMLVNIGLAHVNAGQSTILIYTTQIWVIPIAYLCFAESINRYHFLSLLLGVIGIVILFNPTNINWHDSLALLDNAILLLAAFMWALNIIITRHTPWHTTPLKLLPWQLLIALIPMTVFMLVLEPSPAIHVTPTLILSLLFSGLLGTSYALWGMIVVSKELPVATTSLLLLGVPLLSIVTSNVALGEPITLSMAIAMTLIILGLVLVIVANRNKCKRSPGIVDMEE